MLGSGRRDAQWGPGPYQPPTMLHRKLVTAARLWEPISIAERLNHMPRVVTIVALTVLAACGQTDGRTTDAGPTAATPAATETSSTSEPDAPPSAPPGAFEPTTGPLSEPPTSSPGGDGTPVSREAPLVACSEVPYVTTDVLGDLGGSSNPDEIFMGVVRTYGNEHRDVFGAILIDRDAGGTIVLAVTDDPAPHRAALGRRPRPTDDVGVDPRPAIEDDRPIGEWGVAFDVVQVDFTEDELLAAQEALTPLLQDPDVPVDGSSGGGLRNRVELHAARLVTPDEQRAISAAVAERVAVEMVCLDATVVDELPPAIEPGSKLDVIELPGADGTYPPDIAVECAGIPFTLGAIQPLRPLANFPELQDTINEASGSDEFTYIPDQLEWWLLELTDESATVISPNGSSFTLAPLELTPAGWAVSGLSGENDCDVRRVLPPGLNGVEWELDPDHPAPTPDSTALHLLVTELGCAGGREMGDQLLGPQVVETDDAVWIAFAVIPPEGSTQPCPGNPPAGVTVDLGAPLGDHEIRDGLTIGPFEELVRYG